MTQYYKISLEDLLKANRHYEECQQQKILINELKKSNDDLRVIINILKGDK
jgi:hypothetical protein